MAWMTSAFLSRTASASKEIGGSIAVIASSWNRWLGTMSRSAPVALVELAAPLDADRLRSGDLDVVDVLAIPQRLEQAVGKAQRHDVLDRLLAEEMVHPIDLMLLQRLQDRGVERLGRGQVMAERLLDDDPPPLSVLLGRPCPPPRGRRPRR